MKKSMSKYLWAEKYRPNSVKDMVLPKRFKSFFMGCVEKKEIPNLLLYSPQPGSGKSSLARAICEDMDSDYIYINVSDESGIDTLRSTIKSFASTKALGGGIKVVILDEADGAGVQLQSGLRAFIEEFHNKCRFILTCNYVSKIIRPLREGRVMEFDFSMTDSETVEEMIPKHIKRFSGILNFEKIDYSESVLNEIVRANYPNMRKTIATLQKCSMMYGIIDNNSLKNTNVSAKLYEYILNNKFTQARKHIIESSYDYDELYSNLYREFVPMLVNQKQAQVIIILADYQNRSVSAIDKELNFAACLMEIIGVV